jgi:hypothetical protein
MEIKIRLSNEDVRDILEKYGYKSEKVLVHFKKFEDYDVYELGAYYTTVVYKERPEVLDKDMVMSDDVKDMILETVVAKLYNQLMFEKIL